MTRPPLLFAAALMISPLLIATAQAQVPPPPPQPSVVDRPGFDLGLRLGFALPMGQVAEGGDLSDTIKGLIPLQVDAMYRVNSQYAIGGFFQYGFALVNDPDGECTGGVSCSATMMRLGVQGTLHLAVSGSFVPWFGLGFGYEWLKLKESMAGASQTATLTGFQFLSLQAGGEYRASPDFGVGPFVGLSFGRYSSAEVEGLGSGDIDNQAFHEWLEFGVRGVFNL